MLGRQPGPDLRLLTDDNVLRDMPQWLGRAPVFPEPAERHRIIRAKPEDLFGHWNQRMQIERTRLAHTHTCNGAVVPTASGFAQLAC